MTSSSHPAIADVSPENPGAVLLARTRAGYDLPIIDVTHPRFAVADDSASRAARQQAFLNDHRQRRWIPGFLLRFMLRQLAKKSLLASAMFDRQSPYLDGISTYVMKLGADNLVAPFDSPSDRRFATSSHITLLHLRTPQVAMLIAGGIARDKAFSNIVPLHLINIAGGPALDSINSLILLKRTGPELLRRPIVIHVLDRNEDGAYFGKNALAVLKETGNPLEASMFHSSTRTMTGTIRRRWRSFSRASGPRVASWRHRAKAACSNMAAMTRSSPICASCMTAHASSRAR